MIGGRWPHIPTSPTMTVDEYFDAKGQQLGFPADIQSLKRTYEFNVRSVRDRIQSGELLADLLTELKRLAQLYPAGPSLLFYPADPEDLSIHTKRYESVLSKIYLTNYLNNKSCPGAPRSGIIDHSTIFDRINDLLRSRLEDFRLTRVHIRCWLDSSGTPRVRTHRAVRQWWPRELLSSAPQPCAAVL